MEKLRQAIQSWEAIIDPEELKARKKCFYIQDFQDNEHMCDELELAYLESIPPELHDNYYLDAFEDYQKQHDFLIKLRKDPIEAAHLLKNEMYLKIEAPLNAAVNEIINEWY